MRVLSLVLLTVLASSCKTRDFRDESSATSTAARFETFGPETVVSLTKYATRICFPAPGKIATIDPVELNLETTDLATRRSTVKKITLPNVVNTHWLSPSCKYNVAVSAGNPYEFFFTNLSSSQSTSIRLDDPLTERNRPSFEFSDDESTVAVTEAKNHGIKIYRIDSAEKISMSKSISSASLVDLFNSAAISKNGNFVAYEGVSLNILSTQSGQIKKIAGVGSMVSARFIDVSNSGVVAAVNLNDNLVLVHSETGIQARMTLSGESAIAFSPAGDWFLTATFDNKTWNIRSVSDLKILQTLNVRTILGANLLRPSISPDGKTIALVNPNMKQVVVFKR